MIEAVIFDMDGTLVDSERLSIRAMAELIPQISISTDELLHRFGGQQLTKTFACIEDEFGWRQFEGFEIEFRARVAELIESELEAFDGVHEALGQLAIPFCLATNAPLKKVGHVMRKTGLEPHFGSRLFSAYEIGAWKPDPKLFLTAADTLGIQPEKCLVIEDSIFGIDAARAANMHVLEFCGHGTPLTDRHFKSYADLNFHIAQF